MLTDRIIQLNGRSRVVMASALILILLYAVYSWSLAPHMLYVRAVNHCGSVVEGVQRETTSLEEGLLSEQCYLEDLEHRFDELRTTLFAYEEAKDFFSELEGWARDCQCSMTTVHVDSDPPIEVLSEVDSDQLIEEFPDVESEGMIEAIELEVTLMGPMPGLSEFMRKLQNHPRYVHIESLHLVSADPQANAMQCRVGFRVHAFHE